MCYSNILNYYFHSLLVLQPIPGSYEHYTFLLAKVQLKYDKLKMYEERINVYANKEIFQKLNTMDRSGALHIIAESLVKIHHYAGSLQFQYEALSIFGNPNDPLQRIVFARYASDIGICYLKLGDYKKAVEQFKLSNAPIQSTVFSLYESLNGKTLSQSRLLGLCYHHLGKNDESLKNYLIGLNERLNAKDDGDTEDDHQNNIFR